jgi:NADH-quinone oxidoreductase subunit L
MSPAILTLSALLIFGGIVGKSAQFPLLTWLPDAMEGPTPVSALLHSATMVAAGVFLFARLFPFFSLSPTAMSVFLAIGTISMLLASTMAMVSRDIKQVWAYSTISQLGFMIMALAAGGYFAGVFHLTTHAAFKALLFLCSGVFIHALHTNDIFEFARKGCTRYKIPSLCLLVAAAALAGLPPLSGFFSKEAILAGLAELRNPLWLSGALLGVFLTSYYSFRVIFVIFTPTPNRSVHEGESEVPPASHEDDDHHAPYWPMVWPLIILAALTVVLGFLQGPLQHFVGLHPAAVHGEGHPGWLAYLATGLALAGVVLAFVEFGRRGARQVGFVERVPALYNLFAERWYLDHFYRRVLDRLVDRGIATLFYKNDNKVIDGSIELMCEGTVESGRLFSTLHTVMIQYRLLVVFAVVALLAFYFFL